MTASAPVRSLAAVTSQSKPPRLAIAEPGLVAAGVYANGKRLTDIIVDEASEWSRRPNHVVWLDLHEPTEDLLRRVQRQLGLPEVAVDDALQAHQPPKLEQYGEATFIVTRTAQTTDGQTALGEAHIFVGRGYVVTVRHGASTPFTAVRQRCETRPNSRAHSEGFILHAVLKSIVDGYGLVLDGVRTEVEAIEDRLLTKDLSQGHSELLYLLRRDLHRLRNAATPLVDVCHRLETTEVATHDPEMQRAFRSVSRHAHRIRDEIDSLRETVAFVSEASLMIGQAEQTATIRQFAAWAAILAVPITISGIYGMNFEHMPELKWEFGYYLVATYILGVGGMFYWTFRRKAWL